MNLEEMEKELKSKTHMHNVVFKHWDPMWEGMIELRMEIDELEEKIKKLKLGDDYKEPVKFSFDDIKFE